MYVGGLCRFFTSSCISSIHLGYFGIGVLFFSELQEKGCLRMDLLTFGPSSYQEHSLEHSTPRVLKQVTQWLM